MLMLILTFSFCYFFSFNIALCVCVCVFAFCFTNLLLRRRWLRLALSTTNRHISKTRVAQPSSLTEHIHRDYCCYCRDYCCCCSAELVYPHRRNRLGLLEYCLLHILCTTNNIGSTNSKLSLRALYWSRKNQTYLTTCCPDGI